MMLRVPPLVNRAEGILKSSQGHQIVREIHFHAREASLLVEPLRRSDVRKAL